MPITITAWFLCVKINLYIWITYNLCRKDKSSCRILVVKPLRKWPFKKQWGQVDNGNNVGLGSWMKLVLILFCDSL